MCKRKNHCHAILVGSYLPISIMQGLHKMYCDEDISSIVAQKALINGLRENNVKISVFSVIAAHSRGLIKKIDCKINDIEYHAIIVKKIFYFDKLIKLFYYTPKIMRLIPNVNGANILLFVHGVTSGGCRTAGILKALFYKIKVVLYILDVPEFMNLAGDTGLRQLLKKIDRYIINKYIYNFDKYIVVSEYINSRLHIDLQKSILIEGMYDDEPIVVGGDERNSLLKKRIMYAGTLRDERSIKTIIDAFLQANIHDVIFDIYGFATPKFSQDLILISQQHPNIQYHGFCKNRGELLKKEMNADLLLMLRDPCLEYTKYSFPSKLFEFMASGTPVLVSKLDGINDEYYNYLFVVENFNASEIANCLNRIFKMPHNELKAFGEKAQEFIKQHKTAKVQVKKILDFVVGDEEIA